MNFKVLDKCSASPSIIIKFKNNGNIPTVSKDQILIMKLWITFDTVEEELKKPRGVYRIDKALGSIDYELKVYEDTVTPILSRSKHQYFLKLVGSGRNISSDNIFKLIGGDSDIEREYFNKCIQQYIRNPMQRNASYENPEIEVDLSQIEKSRFNAIIIPAMKISTYRDLLWNPDFVPVLLSFIRICTGLLQLNSAKTTHNDLHSENILVNDNKLAIYDFDRSYTKGYPNPMLNDDCSDGACLYSYCNRFNGHDYLPDFYRILSTVMNSDHRDNICRIIGLTSSQIRFINRSARDRWQIYNGDKETNYLQCPDANPEWLRISREIGTFSQILSRIVINSTEYLKSQDIELPVELQRSHMGFGGVRVNSLPSDVLSIQPRAKQRERRMNMKQIIYNLTLLAGIKVKYPKLPKKPIEKILEKFP